MITHRCKRDASAKDGAALVVVVMFVATLTVLLTTLLTNTNRSLAHGHSAWREQVTRALANAGIQSAAAHLAENPDKYTGEKDVALGEGFFSTHVTKDKQANTFRVVSAGELRDGKLVLRRTVVSVRIVVTGGQIVAIAPSDFPEKDAAP